MFSNNELYYTTYLSCYLLPSFITYKRFLDNCFVKRKLQFLSCIYRVN